MQRFWDKVNKEGSLILEDPCWEWERGRNEKEAGGYGIFYLNGKKVKAHKFSYELEYGPVPLGLILLHRCDNPPCVRPTHLRAGTRLDNTLDAVAKGRHVASGLRLSEMTVLAIKAEYGAGSSQMSLCRKYSVPRATMHDIVTGRRRGGT